LERLLAGWLLTTLIGSRIALVCLSCGMKQVGRTYAAQPKNLAIHSPSFSSENSLNKERGGGEERGDFETYKREIPLAFISFT
jgi:hypothetical protein